MVQSIFFVRFSKNQSIYVTVELYFHQIGFNKKVGGRTFLIICSRRSSMVIVDLLSLINWPRTAWGWQHDWRRRRRGFNKTCKFKRRWKPDI